MSAAGREDRRQFVHLLTTSFVVLLRWLDPTGAALCAAGAVVLNWVVLPLLSADFRRPGAPFLDGVRTYPVAVLALVLLLPLPAAGAAWVVLGVGDAASNVIGRRRGHPPFAGRSDRSLAGTLGFVAAAAPAAVAAWWFVADQTPDARHVAALCAAALAGAIAELVPLPGRVDDNLPIAAAAGLTLFALL